MDRLLPVRGRGKTTPCFRLPALRHGCGVTELESLFHAEAQCSQRLARTALASSLRSLRLCMRTLAFNTAGGDSAFRDLQVSRAGSTGHFWHQVRRLAGGTGPTSLQDFGRLARCHCSTPPKASGNTNLTDRSLRASEGSVAQHPSLARQASICGTTTLAARLTAACDWRTIWPELARSSIFPVSGGRKACLSRNVAWPGRAISCEDRPQRQRCSR